MLVSEPKEEIQEKLKTLYIENGYTTDFYIDVSEDNNWNELEEKVNNNHLSHLPNGKTIKERFGENHKLHLYGEVTFKGVEILLRKFEKYFNKDAVFYDLGSGFGKMVNHVSMRTNIKKSCGIEYSKKRTKEAKKLSKKINNENNVVLLEADIFEADLSDATIVYWDNTAWPLAMLVEVEKKLPKGCLFIFKQGAIMTGDRWLLLETNYNIDIRAGEEQKIESWLVWEYWQKRACWKIVGHDDSF